MNLFEIKRFFSCLLKSFLVMGLVFPISFSVGAVPLSSWDKKIDNVDERFKVLLEWNAVLDNETQLLWVKQPSDDIVRWKDALRRCNYLALGNRLGWRLPTIAELTSLTSGSGMGISYFGPFHVLPGVWSSTETGLNSDEAWFLHTGLYFATPSSKKSFYAAWCVRGKHPSFH